METSVILMVVGGRSVIRNLSVIVPKTSVISHIGEKYPKFQDISLENAIYLRFMEEEATLTSK